MTGYQFVVRNYDFSRTQAVVAFPAEGFEDVTFSAGIVNDRGTYVVTLRSGSPRSLKQATDIFRNIVVRERALVAESAMD